jgi:NADPH:quinone reductase-like Zn-dependent oxidoreductase
MKAILQYRYGSPDVLELREVEKPVVGDDSVLVRVRAASLNVGDWHYMRGVPYLVRMRGGLSKPKQSRLGSDVAGHVEAVGKNVTQFRPDDAVFGARRGAFGEYVSAGEGNFVLKPDNLTFEQAAGVPVAGLTALQGLRDKGHVQPGQRVLINGASGGVGTFAVQIAKAFGADVTAVCSTRNVEMARSIGADQIIDYTREDFTRGRQRYDMIFDVAGNRSLLACRRVLGSNGTIVLAGVKGGRRMGPILARLLAARALSRVRSQKMLFFLAAIKKEDLIVLKELIEAGKLSPVIDRTYPLSQTPDAIRYLEEGHARGKVIITV